MHMQTKAVPMSPVLDEESRALVRRCLAAGLVAIDDIKKVVVSLMAEERLLNPDNLVDGLVGSGVLTTWQGKKLLVGASKGFYLGNYKLLRPLGRGGMGVVFLGEHHVMKRRMALKILPPEANQDKRRIDRFKAEAEACAQLDHENIVRAYDFGESFGKLYIVMEYVDGIDLGQAVARDGVMTPQEGIDALTQACAGLAHAHERGIVHRDIKPSNLLLRSDGVVKVSDLGLARIGFSGVEEGSKRMMGTADYLAPEQAIDSQTVDSRADIYALGCTLFYLLTGSPPYRGATITKTLAKHQTAPIPDLREKCPQCPGAIADLARRMMAKRPSDRPRSAVELLSELKRLGGQVDRQSSLANHSAHVDTIVDDSGFGMTIDGSANSHAEATGEIDFSNLPPIELGNLHLNSQMTLDIPSPLMPTSGWQAKPTAANSNRHSGSNNQTLMLGVGLTLAVVALIAVGVMTYSAMTQPLPQTQPKIKSHEGKDGKTIIFVDQ
jgi:eukaryotic-like serine/threonine-protein kinase